MNNLILLKKIVNKKVQILLLLLIIQIICTDPVVFGQHIINDDLVVEKNGSTTVEVRNISSYQWSKAGINFVNTQSSSGSWYQWFAEKTGSTTGYSNLLLRKHTSDGWLNLIFYSDQTNDLTFNASKSSSSAFGNYIFKNGKIGIGQSAPAATVDIHNTSLSENITSLSDVTTKSILKLRPHSTNSTSFYFGQGNSGRAHIIQAANGAGTGAYELSFNPFGGNVGIGILAPTSALHVNGDIRSNKKFVLSGIGAIESLVDNHLNLWSLKDIIFNASGSTTEMMRIKADGKIGIGNANPSANLTVRGSGNNDTYKHFVVEDQYGNEDLVIDGLGRLKIGYAATFPTGSNYLLSVDGKVLAEEVVVTLSENWPDYVFEKDYPLMPLTDLKTFLEQNKHLPDIPSADEINQDGQALGKMNMLLLKKVEELTLYVIQLEEKNQVLEEDKEDILKRIEKLELLIK